MTPADIKATSDLYWVSALVTALIDGGFVLLLAWRIKPAQFRQLVWALVVASAIFWSMLWTAVLWGDLWDLAFRYVLPGWARWIYPFYGLLHGVVGLALWWLAPRLPGNPVVNFCLLGGLESLPEHLWAIYGRRILEKVPLLQGVSPASALVFGVFEFIFYWSIIMSITVLLRRGWQWWRHLEQRGANVV